MTEQNYALALWITGPNRAEIRTEPVAALRAGDVLVRTLYSGVSRGTETLVYSGRVPESEHDRMRAPFQAGAFPAPVKYGYISVGIVESGAEELVGRTVFCLYPHQTHYVVPADAVHVLPDGIPAARAVLAANLEAATNALWDAAPGIGTRVAVVGAGTLGCLVAWLAATRAGCDVELIDIDATKAAPAAALGVTFRIPDDATRDADVVFHASGTERGLATALELAGFEAVVLELSWYGNRLVGVPLGEAFHSRRLTLKSSQVSTVAPAQRARWTSRQRMALVLSLLDDARLDALITGESAFDDLPDVLARLSSAPRGTLCHRIHYTREAVGDLEASDV
jgi:threonine dehydrogenase-like Zn-dependent dehydrogenase